MHFPTRLFLVCLLPCGLCFTPATYAAPIELKHNGIGDALIYPAFIGYFENWFTLHNDSDRWLQGHIRFRSATWGGELLDFDVILSPGDVMIFRLADMDGDGEWEIDQSIDPSNFAYTSLTQSCGDGAVANCMDLTQALVPNETSLNADGDSESIVHALLADQRNGGYIVFIGECELRNMTPAKMRILLSGGTLVSEGMHLRSRASIGTGLGTNCWAWSDAGAGFEQDSNGPASTHGLGDFPNVASGSGFIRLPGRALGMAYNAEVFVNFRTDQHPHRIDSYRIVGDISLDAADADASQRNRAVILHDENRSGNNGGQTPFGHYIYHYDSTSTAESRLDEALFSFATTFGPTLADGDDYDLTGNAQTINGEARNIYDGNGALRTTDPSGVFDDWDIFRFNSLSETITPDNIRINSIAEVEEAIRIGGQRFTSFYLDTDNAIGGGASLISWYFALFPTRFFYGEDLPLETLISITEGNLPYQDAAVGHLQQLDKLVDIEIWDEWGSRGSNSMLCNHPCFIPPIPVLSQSLSAFTVDSFFKSVYPTNTRNYGSGRVVLTLNSNEDFPWPGLVYTFEAGPGLSELEHWRSMNRRDE